MVDMKHPPPPAELPVDAAPLTPEVPVPLVRVTAISNVPELSSPSRSTDLII